MAALFMNGDLCNLLNAEIAQNAPWTMHLYQNNHTPANADTLAAYTEATYSGYAAQNLSFGSCSVVANQAQRVATALIFTVGAGGVSNTIYGYYITDAAGNLVCAELLSGGPFSMTIVGTTLTITYTATQVSA